MVQAEALIPELQRLSVGGTPEPQTAPTGEHGENGQLYPIPPSPEPAQPAPQQEESPQPPSDTARTGPREVLAHSLPLPGDAAVGFLYDRSMEEHVGPDHYERPARIIALHAALEEQQLLGRCWQLVPRQATDEELLLGHTAEHIQKVDAMFSEQYSARPESLASASYCYTDGAEKGDVYVCEGTAVAARVATGCCVEAVRAVLSGEVSSALAVVRPPGHHAECERAMGFCFFNNVAVAALAALQFPGVKRVAVLDWDIHHGNGIQNILLQRPDALYISLHRDPKRFYPFTSGFAAEAGEGAGEGFNVNVPWLKKGIADGDYMAAFSLVVEPVLRSYQPDLIIVAAGFDAADGDPLGGCKLSPEGYGWMTEQLLQFAGGKVVLALEGGYNNRVTAWCASACVRTLLEGRAPPLPADKEHRWPAEAHESLKRVYEVQRQYWPVLRSRGYTEAWEAHLQEVNLMLGSNSRAKRGTGANSASGGGAAPAAASSSGGRRPSASSSSSAAAAAVAAVGPVDGGFLAQMADAMQAGSGADGGGAAAAAPSPTSLADAFRARKAAAKATAAAVAPPVSGVAASALASGGAGAAAAPAAAVAVAAAAAGGVSSSSGFGVDSASTSRAATHEAAECGGGGRSGGGGSSSGSGNAGAQCVTGPSFRASGSGRASGKGTGGTAGAVATVAADAQAAASLSLASSSSRPHVHSECGGEFGGGGGSGATGSGGSSSMRAATAPAGTSGADLGMLPPLSPPPPPLVAVGAPD